jgi:hypothetical protein
MTAESISDVVEQAAEDGDEEPVGRRSVAAGPFLLSKVLKTNNG